MAFLATTLPQPVQEAISEALTTYRSQFSAWRWVHPQDYHLTLRFFGGDSLELKESLITSLTMASPSFKLFTLEAHGLAYFPPHSDGGVLWLSLASLPQALTTLQQRLEIFAQSLGFAADTKVYTPHITLARFPTGDLPHVMRLVQKPFFVQMPSWPVDCYHLMGRKNSAQTTGSEPVYERWHTVRWSGSPPPE